MAEKPGYVSRNLGPGVRDYQRTAAAVRSPGSSPASARRVVLVSGVVLFGYVLATGKGQGVETYSRVYSVGVVTLGLCLLADFAPSIAGPMAALIVLGLIVTPQGQEALNRIPRGKVTAANSPAHTGATTN